MRSGLKRFYNLTFFFLNVCKALWHCLVYKLCYVNTFSWIWFFHFQTNTCRQTLMCKKSTLPSTDVDNNKVCLNQHCEISRPLYQSSFNHYKIVFIVGLLYLFTNCIHFLYVPSINMYQYHTEPLHTDYGTCLLGFLLRTDFKCIMQFSS